MGIEISTLGGVDWPNENPPSIAQTMMLRLIDIASTFNDPGDKQDYQTKSDQIFAYDRVLEGFFC